MAKRGVSMKKVRRANYNVGEAGESRVIDGGRGI